jgi:hypothetical protein
MEVSTGGKRTVDLLPFLSMYKRCPTNLAAVADSIAHAVDAPIPDAAASDGIDSPCFVVFLQPRRAGTAFHLMTLDVTERFTTNIAPCSV